MTPFLVVHSASFQITHYQDECDGNSFCAAGRNVLYGVFY